MSPIKNWPVNERPREKLQTKGERSLSDAELLALIINTGNRGESSIDLGRRILQFFGTFRQMGMAQQVEWDKIKGLGPAKMAQIKAALEIGRRYRENEIVLQRRAIRSSHDVIDFIAPQIRDLTREIFKTIFLNAKNFVIDIEISAEGTVNQAVPFVREILHSALNKNAVSLICCHNHPSGDPAPSEQDKRFTKELKNAASMLNLKLLDHIIIGNNASYSFTDDGEL